MRKRFSDLEGTWTDDDARAVLEEWRRSGDSIAVFARRHSVSAWRLYSWRKKLRTMAKPGAKQISVIYEKYADLPARVGRLETNVFGPHRAPRKSRARRS